MPASLPLSLGNSRTGPWPAAWRRAFRASLTCPGPKARVIHEIRDGTVPWDEIHPSPRVILESAERLSGTYDLRGGGIVAAVQPRPFFDRGDHGSRSFAFAKTGMTTGR